ncbi:MAG: hypothetical protein ABFS45_18130, partial [Pseudomonadota bacterium]
RYLIADKVEDLGLSWCERFHADYKISVFIDSMSFKVQKVRRVVNHAGYKISPNLDLSWFWPIHTNPLIKI